MILTTSFLIKVTQALVFLVAEMVAVLLFQKVLLIVVELWKEERRRHYASALQHYLCEATSWESLAIVYPGDSGILLELMLQCAENLSGGMLNRIRDASQQLGLEKRVSRDLYSSRWWIRARAAWRLGLIGGPDSLPELLEALQDPVREVRLMSIRGLAYLNGALALEPILEHFTDLSRWASFEMSEIVSRLGSSAVPVLIQALRNPVPQARYMAIDLLGYLRDERSLTALLPFLSSKDPEERIRGVKAVGHLDHPQALDHLMGMIPDPRWEVRLLVCKAIGRLGGRPHIAVLERLLKDASRRVGAAAAEALHQFGEPGLAVLHKAGVS